MWDGWSDGVIELSWDACDVFYRGWMLLVLDVLTDRRQRTTGAARSAGAAEVMRWPLLSVCDDSSME